jgi:hypothetical protein
MSNKNKDSFSRSESVGSQNEVFNKKPVKRRVSFEDERKGSFDSVRTRRNSGSSKLSPIINTSPRTPPNKGIVMPTPEQLSKKMKNSRRSSPKGSSDENSKKNVKPTRFGKTSGVGNLAREATAIIAEKGIQTNNHFARIGESTRRGRRVGRGGRPLFPPFGGRSRSSSSTRTKLPVKRRLSFDTPTSAKTPSKTPSKQTGTQTPATGTSRPTSEQQSELLKKKREQSKKEAQKKREEAQKRREALLRESTEKLNAIRKRTDMIISEGGRFRSDLERNRDYAKKRDGKLSAKISKIDKENKKPVAIPNSKQIEKRVRLERKLELKNYITKANLNKLIEKLDKPRTPNKERLTKTNVAEMLKPLLDKKQTKFSLFGSLGDIDKKKLAGKKPESVVKAVVSKLRKEVGEKIKTRTPRAHSKSRPHTPHVSHSKTHSNTPRVYTRTPTTGQRKKHVIELIDRVLRRMKVRKDIEKKLMSFYGALSERYIKNMFGGRTKEEVKAILKKQVSYFSKKR